MIRFRVLVYGAAFVWSCALLARPARGDDARPDERQLPAHASTFRCATNCAYMLLQLLDRDVEYATLLERLPPRREGHSLLQLKQALTESGVVADVVRLDLAQLQALNGPCIAMLRSQARADAPPGHFVVVTHCAGERIHTIDGTAGRPYRYRHGQFWDRWEGYLLVPRESRRHSGNWPWWIMLSIDIPVLVWGAWYGWRRFGLSAYVAPLSAAMLLCLLLCPANAGVEPGSSSEDTAGDAQWRTADGDALLAAFLILRLYGIDRDYIEFRQQYRERLTKTSSLAAVRDALRDEGLPTRIVQLTPTSLVAAPKPAIVHLDSLVGSGSRFVVLLDDKSDMGWPLIEAGFALYAVAPDEEFRRAWSGVALVPEQGRDWICVPLAVSIGCGYAGFRFLRWWQLKSVLGD